MKTLFVLLFSIGLITSSFMGFSQEYDDLYFTKRDRQQKTKTSSLAIHEPDGVTSFLGRQIEQENRNYSNPEETYTATNVSEESINRYKRSNIDQYVGEDGEIQDEEVANPNYSTPEETYGNQPVVVNNYYGVGTRLNRNRSRWGFNSRWGTWGTGFGASYGWGSFGAPWYNPFWDPYYNGFWNGPWYGFGYNSWGLNRWGGFYDPFWCPPFYGNGFINGYRGFYGAPIVVTSGENVRNVQRGPRNSRGGELSSREGSRRITGSPNEAAHLNDTREFGQQQTEYLNKSRRSAQISNANSGSSVHTRRSSSGNSSGNSMGTGSYNSRPSSKRNSYSTPARPSRSSSGSYRSYTPSRSGSGTIRPSGSSSRSRSSGSVRSGSRGSKRGN